MLSINALEAGYGGAKALFGVDLEVNAGEVLALVGRNGMGKTTTVRCLFGLLRPTSGRIGFLGRDLTGRSPFEIARQGLGLVPEGRQIFPTLSVEENLVATAAVRFGERRWTLEAIYQLFPRLAERRRHLGNQLSGGEQQMLAIGRALMTNPKLLVLDEATEGLAPLIRAEIWACLKRLKAEGLSILLIDKNIQALLSFVDRLAVIEKGRIVWTGAAAHPMYPVGSNGAAQAILDARSLADNLLKADHQMQALYAYEDDRLAKTAEIVRLNRKGGPERVIDEVEKLAPAGFEYVDRVLSRDEREAIVKGYAGKAGFALAQVNK